VIRSTAIAVHVVLIAIIAFGCNSVQHEATFAQWEKVLTANTDDGQFRLLQRGPVTALKNLHQPKADVEIGFRSRIETYVLGVDGRNIRLNVFIDHEKVSGIEIEGDPTDASRQSLKKRFNDALPGVKVDIKRAVRKVRGGTTQDEPPRTDSGNDNGD
jgi:hypothetical protein